MIEQVDYFFNIFRNEKFFGYHGSFRSQKAILTLRLSLQKNTDSHVENRLVVKH